ncbi:hypothetical protein ACIQGT_13900 [Streptomyces sp. NPDC093108]|uniref:hypothetical protein n=1 Tax=unclassified Streptomyces TaxID=2593676 RepID=UPI0037F2D8BF
MTMTIVIDSDLFPRYIDAGLLDEVYAWWQANSLSLSEYWVSGPVAIETDSQGGRTLHYTAPLHGPGGDPERTERRSVPLLVEPPAHWAPAVAATPHSPKI